MNIKKAKIGAPHKYELSFKRKICEELLSGEITVGELSRKYNISGAGTIRRWLNWYQAEQSELVSLHPMSNKPENNSEGEQDKTALQKELELAKAKIATLETMIDIAEEQFKIEIRKKSGTKPSVE